MTKNYFQKLLYSIVFVCFTFISHVKAQHQPNMTTFDVGGVALRVLSHSKESWKPTITGLYKQN
ncbi:sensor histidine kinase, partial [Vibrio parahaemolyticus]|nr:sensor histidine kinase [Vibrio parahaemolyticus]